ncbi:MAG: nickel pincer cofactor biosynthesis protein LarC [Candidatus Brocadiia bacterium]
MRTIYFDCSSGVSGDMCLGALVDGGVPLSHISDTLEGLPFEGYTLEEQKVTRAGLAATRVKVQIDESHEPPHRHLEDVMKILHGGNLDARIAEKAGRVFQRLARAEAGVHDTTPGEVHFHEVGAIDAICDITGTVAGLEWLNPDRILFSRISVGGGRVDAAHGRLPVPAPATVELLRGYETCGGPIDEELTTPTGAALLTCLGENTPRWPDMSIEKIGIGAGGRNPDTLPNVLRLVVGTSGDGGGESDYIWQIETNLDDATGEEIGFCVNRLREEGALDVFTTPVQTKKDRPAVKLTVLCKPGRRRKMENLLFQLTPTIGVRRNLMERARLRRHTERVSTPWGEVRMKVAELPGGKKRATPEYDDCAALARRHNISLRRVFREAYKARQQTSPEQPHF